MERVKIIQKAKKLKELADRGIGGEQVNAKVMYANFCQKHNITDNEIGNCNTINSEYSEMSDADFLNEIMNEGISLAFSLFFSRWGNQKHKEESKQHLDSFLSKVLIGMTERANNKTKK